MLAARLARPNALALPLHRAVPQLSRRTMASLPAPRLFDYDTITKHLTVKDALPSVESAFAELANGKVDVPLPMHIGPLAGEPGDCHIKGGYVIGTKTFTVKLACVSFYANLKKDLPPGSGIFIVVSAETGAPLGIFQENRYMTDLRTGAAGGISFKHLSKPGDDQVGFIGCGAIARVMARAAAAIRPFHGFAYAQEGAEQFCKDMESELGMPFSVVASGEELCRKSQVVYTQTPGSETVVQKSWLRAGMTIICSGSDQPTKQEIPTEVLASSKYICDLVKQVSRVGELRSALADGSMTESSVHAELGQVINGSKPGREGDEIIVCDLTGTGAQDAAICQVAWDKLSAL